MHDKKYTEIAEKTIRWLKTEEGRKALQLAKDKSAKITEEFNNSLRVSPESLNRPITI